MIISHASPQELVEWFQTGQEGQRLLVVLLAPASADQAKLVSLIDDVFAADAVLGQEIAFLLLHPASTTPIAVDRGYGQYATLRGTTFPRADDRSRQDHPVHDVHALRDLSDVDGPYRQEISKKSASSMARFVPEFMTLFGVEPGELPALCVLVKGLDESVVLPLSKEWTKEDLLSIFCSLRSATDKAANFHEQFQTLADRLPEKLPRVEDSTREIAAKSARISDMLERLLNRYNGTDADRRLIADFIAQQLPDSASLEKVLAKLSFSNVERFQKDGQALKVRDLMSRVEAVRNSLSDDLTSRTYLLSIADLAKNLAEERERLFTELGNIQRSRLKTTSAHGSRILNKIRPVLEGVNLVGDVGEKLANAIEWVKKLLNW